MTRVLITVDTEYSAAYFEMGRRANFDISVLGRTAEGTSGLPYQLDVLDRYGLKAVFFVDPMPALIWGDEAISDVTRMILDRGHDVQLHLHTEWLALAGKANPLGRRTGTNIKDFSLDDQRTLISVAADLLMAAGAPRPVAFRAGNYGANDDTLRALAELGIAYDSSFCPGIARSGCAVELQPDQIEPIAHCGITEVPIGAIAGFRGSRRHAQVTALSAAEMIEAIRFARDERHACFTLVLHSFELVSRDGTRTNHIVRRRFETLCERLARLQGVRTATYAHDPPTPVAQAPGRTRSRRLPHSVLRTGWRMAEQFAANRLYGTA
jgi:peptidoglycan/xylan/chitin deacetylase (PgdA/CDA1 family)